jgi:hypothetical protein
MKIQAIWGCFSDVCNGNAEIKSVSVCFFSDAYKEKNYLGVIGVTNDSPLYHFTVVQKGPSIIVCTHAFYMGEN